MEKNKKVDTTKDLCKVGYYYMVNIPSLAHDIEAILFNEGYYDPEWDEDDIYLDATVIDKLDIPASSVDFTDELYDENDVENYLLSLLQEANHYLVFASGCRWNGASGYTIVDDIKDTIHRNYPISIYPKAISEDKKKLTCLEFSHDVPTGHSTFIIALSDEEKAFLEDANFEEVKRFVENIKAVAI